MNSGVPTHLDDELLLRMLDGEVPPARQQEATTHIEACWSCRARLRQMEQAITQLIAWRNKELAAQDPPPEGGRQRLATALARQQPGRRDSGPFTTLRRAAAEMITAFALNRARYASVFVAASTILLLVLLPLAEPPRITAAVFLQRARLARSTGSSADRRVIHERVEIRYGQRVQQREITIQPGRRPTAQLASLPGDTLALPRMEDGPISWDDPMGVEAFERWHDGLGSRKDTIEESPDAITLRTEAGRDTIVAASLIVRRADWRPIAKHVEFSDASGLAVRQISYEVRAGEEAAEAAVTAALPAAHARPPQEPQEFAVERAEIAVREALHRIGADRNEIPEIRRADGGLSVRAIAESSGRRLELIRAIQSIPLAHTEIADASAAMLEAVPLTASPAPARIYSTTPPLAKELWDYAHGMDAANRQLNAVRESYFAVLPTAKALRRLAERYSGPQWTSLPPDVRGRVDALAAWYAEDLRSSGAAYLAGVSNPLDEMLRRKATPEAGETSSGGPCRPWQALAASMVSDLEGLHTTFRRLFVVEETTEPVVLSGPALLSEAAATRARLLRALSELCAGRDQDGHPAGRCDTCQ
ncbi:hypothetical protein [uncultured Paludibaculum sp.]|uniref:anti-sigma factor family protein n=1 Tax=uncultured Paludibaculum sp. TaxID=1765020 RepID=UPI002AAB6A89|nr:hypothetical protein [uncultured Paludibaculum sp.]